MVRPLPSPGRLLESTQLSTCKNESVSACTTLALSSVSGEPKTFGVLTKIKKEKNFFCITVAVVARDGAGNLYYYEVHPCTKKKVPNS